MVALNGSLYRASQPEAKITNINIEVLKRLYDGRTDFHPFHFTEHNYAVEYGLSITRLCYHCLVKAAMETPAALQWRCYGRMQRLSGHENIFQIANARRHVTDYRKPTNVSKRAVTYLCSLLKRQWKRFWNNLLDSWEHFTELSSLVDRDTNLGLYSTWTFAPL